MLIQFNTDKNVILNEEQIASYTSLISEELSRFSTQITRLEIHLSDEDGNKDGSNDKRCLVEARLEGMKPTAATDHSNTLEKAMFGAIDKLKTSLETISGRLNDY
ncbi:HPF/RaiA family ribosome-associated protein [Flavobacterium cellulosilyticum]|uniref:HPF/RaiA family ribosome-associated protein n=1 Tax=Flavobacterium cellulosilyticum TaxID=2541731 RepID=A0A4R5CAF3_9FLAO|nr:HPF/RaiA family ribosome-associated protein [Flavobacterium cellulosilyticum]TDD96888.1 HPF/RaiA family ribosome-associated protein [Flavobacterium cellulosilyticum]